MFFKLNGGVVFDKFFEWLTYFFIGFFPFISYQGFLFYGTTSRAVNLIVLVEILIVFICIYLFNKKSELYIAKSPVTIALAFFLLVSFISGLLGVDFASSFWSKATRMSGLFYMLHLGIFYLCLLMLMQKESLTRNFLRAFLVGAGVFSIGALLSNDGFGVIFTAEKWTGFTFGNSSFAAMYLYAAFMVAVYFVFSGENKSKWKYLIPFIFIINPYFLNINLWSGGVNVFKNPMSMIGEAQASSAAVFMSVFVLLFAFLVSKISRDDIKKKILAASVLGGVVVLTVASSSLVTSGGYFQNLYLKEASKARPIVWELSKKSINERPWFGWGGDNFDRSFEKNYDNSILEQENGAEPWFDRAHNIFIDQTVETGYLGLVSYLLVYVSILGSLTYVLCKSREKKHKLLATILIVYFGGHIMELQTAFDTTISYVSLAVMAGLASSIFSQTYKSEVGESSFWSVPKMLQYLIGVTLVVFLVVSFFIGTVSIIRSNYANGAIRIAGSSEKRLPIYSSLFSSPVDRATFLWKSSNDFQRGVAEKPIIIEDQLKREGLIKELSVYTEEYRKYANAHPEDYRIRSTLAGVYIYERLLGVDHLNEAHKVLDDAISISPQIPQAYWMKSVAYLYQRKFDLARDWAKKGYDLNLNVEQSKKIVDYIERSIKTFPEIDFYTFGQI